MKLNEIKPAEGSVKKRQRKGRGNASGMGTQASRGHKGQKSRSGYSRKAGFEGGQTPLYRRVPKKRGFRNPFKVPYSVINLDQIEQHFAQGDIVSPQSLHEKGLIENSNRVKVLGNGELKKSVTIEAHRFSESAKQKLDAQKIKYTALNV